MLNHKPTSGRTQLESRDSAQVKWQASKYKERRAKMRSVK